MEPHDSAGQRGAKFVRITWPSFLEVTRMNPHETLPTVDSGRLRSGEGILWTPVSNMLLRIWFLDRYFGGLKYIC